MKSVTITNKPAPTPEQQIDQLTRRVQTLEEQVLLCLRWMRIAAEKEAKMVDPSFKTREPISA